ncbi:hypothetical protein EDB85DRAFT_2280443 [Lactarius pseudohatsudake]|nr:hypothetical protein EDB85DRAFT_2280443 [Lactarius pseudohatsudake]
MAHTPPALTGIMASKIANYKLASRKYVGRMMCADKLKGTPLMVFEGGVARFLSFQGQLYKLIGNLLNIENVSPLLNLKYTDQVWGAAAWLATRGSKSGEPVMMLSSCGHIATRSYLRWLYNTFAYVPTAGENNLADLAVGKGWLVYLPVQLHYVPDRPSIPQAISMSLACTASGVLFAGGGGGCQDTASMAQEISNVCSSTPHPVSLASSEQYASAEDRFLDPEFARTGTTGD